MKRLLISFAILISAISGSIGFATPTQAAACEYLLGMPAWYRGMIEDDRGNNCNIKLPTTGDKVDITKTVMKIAMNVLQTLLMLTGFIAIFFIIKGGFRYMTSAGSPEGMQAARKTITNAIIGLIIAALSASIVNFIAGAF